MLEQEVEINDFVVAGQIDGAIDNATYSTRGESLLPALEQFTNRRDKVLTGEVGSTAPTKRASLTRY